MLYKINLKLKKKLKLMINLKVTFSIDPTGFGKDITEVITISTETCLCCLHDKDNRFIREVKKAIGTKGYDISNFCQIMKIYTL